MSKHNLVIIGSGIEALILAGAALKKGLSVAILDSSQKLGGSLAPLDYHGSYIDSLYSRLPHTQENIDAITRLDSHLPYFEPIQILEQERITFEKGQLEPFVGFGENAPNSIELITPFCSQEKIKTRLNITQLVQRLGEKADIHLNCTFTDILIYNKKIASITVDEKKKFEADFFIFTKHPAELADLLPQGTLLPKTISKLAPKNTWAYLNLLCVSQNPVSENSACHIFYGTQKNPQVCLGEFHQVLNNQNIPVFYSQWICFLNQDTQDLSEDSVQALKEMKRQIKRAYPLAFNDLVFEKIALFEDAKATIDLSSKNFGQLTEFENLLVCSHQLLSEPHIFAASLQATAKTLDLFESLLKATAAEAESKTPDIASTPSDAQL